VTAIDTNILIAAIVPGHEDHLAAVKWLGGLSRRDDIVLSEFVLVELYGLLGNPAVLSKPLGPDKAAALCQTFRQHPRWRLFGFPPDSAALHNGMWIEAARSRAARRRIYDVRLALSLVQQGVSDFATANVKHFDGMGFQRVWNPLDV